MTTRNNRRATAASGNTGVSEEFRKELHDIAIHLPQGFVDAFADLSNHRSKERSKIQIMRDIATKSGFKPEYLRSPGKDALKRVSFTDHATGQTTDGTRREVYEECKLLVCRIIRSDVEDFILYKSDPKGLSAEQSALRTLISRRVSSAMDKWYYDMTREMEDPDTPKPKPPRTTRTVRERIEDDLEIHDRWIREDKDPVYETRLALRVLNLYGFLVKAPADKVDYDKVRVTIAEVEKALGMGSNK